MQETAIRVREDKSVQRHLLDILVTAAGISGFGSRVAVAGYFLTRPDQMNKELSKPPKEWRQKNLQFVLKTPVVEGAPTAPELWQ